jgi:hypothetical protein
MKEKNDPCAMLLKNKRDRVNATTPKKKITETPTSHKGIFG